jgi:diadenosine tetraphosphatase ApaH/serine/threonine PP2A family protein phosphatase
VVAGVEEGDGFNHAAKIAAFWTRDHLSVPNRRFLENLALGPVLRDGVLLCHGAPDDEDEYVFNEIHASRIFDETDASIILYGHTHLPVIFSVDERGRVRGAAVNGDAAFRLDAGYRYLINPGSVGQPRDRNPRASCAIVDSRKMTAQFFRVPYDLRKTQSAILKAGLPPMLAHRLKWGT